MDEPNEDLQYFLKLQRQKNNCNQKKRNSIKQIEIYNLKDYSYNAQINITQRFTVKT